MNTHVRDNLSDLDGRAYRQYAVTLADVAGSTTETTILTATIAEAVADGDVIITWVEGISRNGSGGNRSPAWDALYGGIEADLFDDEWAESGANQGRIGYLCMWTRRGADMEVCLTFRRGDATNWDVGRVHGVSLVAPSFAVSQTLSLKFTLDAANANYFYKPSTEGSGFCFHLRAAA